MCKFCKGAKSKKKEHSEETNIPKIGLQSKKRRYMNFLDVCKRINQLEEQQRRQHLIEIMTASEHHCGNKDTKWIGSLKTMFELPDGTIERNIALIESDECENKYLKQFSAGNDQCGNEVFQIYRICQIDPTGKTMVHEGNLPVENCMGNNKINRECPDILTAATTSELKRPDGCTELSVLVATRSEVEDETAFSKITTLLDFCGNTIGTERRTFIRDNTGNTIKQQETQNNNI